MYYLIEKYYLYSWVVKQLVASAGYITVNTDKIVEEKGDLNENSNNKAIWIAFVAVIVILIIVAVIAFIARNQLSTILNNPGHLCCRSLSRFASCSACSNEDASNSNAMALSSSRTPSNKDSNACGEIEEYLSTSSQKTGREIPIEFNRLLSRFSNNPMNKQEVEVTLTQVKIQI